MKFSHVLLSRVTTRVIRRYYLHNTWTSLDYYTFNVRKYA